MNEQGERFDFHAADGAPLAGVMFGETGPRVLVAGALGVPQRFYAAFCSWLAARGHRVMSFDPRGIGASRRGPLRGLQVDMLGWARLDFAAALRHLAGEDGVQVIGHSLGAHHAAMTDAATQARISHLVAVAAGAGPWRSWAAPSRRRAPLMLHIAGPLLTPLFGHFPGARLGMVADLPAGVMRQWTRWCRHPQFAWGAEPGLVMPSLQSARFPITALAISDDEAMTEHNVRTLLAALPNAPSTLRLLRPADFSLVAIGHLGAFRRSAAALWSELAAAIDNAAPCPQHPNSACCPSSRR
jgi:predicted alpha/beta hydrolase